MTNRTPAITEIVHAWTDAEREVWNAWSQVGQDVSQPDTTSGCGHVLDAMEASARQVVTMQSAVVRGVCGALVANPLLPNEGRAWIEGACRPLLDLSNMQRHLLAGWFGMARQMAATASAGTGPLLK
jgi:hypothetical protein